MVTFLIYCKNW